MGKISKVCGGEIMIVFLSCGKTKAKHTCKASEMYQGDLFKKSFEYAKKLKPRKIYILSAKYKLLELEDVISPYELTLNTMNKQQQKKWAYDVYLQLKEKGQKIVQISDSQESLFSISSQGKSCYDVIRELLYKSLTLNSSISLQSIPIYYLEPNTLIEVNEPNANVYGNFVIQSLSIPLGYSGNMSISAVQAQTRV